VEASCGGVRQIARGRGYAPVVRQFPTAPVAAGSLIVGYAVVLATGSRTLGGVVLAIGGLWCIHAWASRHGTRTATTLGCIGLALFVASHLLALVVGAWPSVLVVATVMAAVAWARADATLPVRA
jgi:hypothetical protein